MRKTVMFYYFYSVFLSLAATRMLVCPKISYMSLFILRVVLAAVSTKSYLIKVDSEWSVSSVDAISLIPAHL